MKITAVMALAMVALSGCQVEQDEEVAEVKIDPGGFVEPTSRPPMCPHYRTDNYDIPGHTPLSLHFLLRWKEGWGHQICLNLTGDSPLTTEMAPAKRCDKKKELTFLSVKPKGDDRVALYGEDDGTNYRFLCKLKDVNSRRTRSHENPPAAPPSDSEPARDSDTKALRWIVAKVDVILPPGEGEPLEGEEAPFSLKKENECWPDLPSECRNPWDEDPRIGRFAQ